MLSKEEKLRMIMTAFRNAPIPGVYQLRGEEATESSCDRFCRNVCTSLYPFQFEQCISDCLDCQGNFISETDESLLD